MDFNDYQSKCLKTAKYPNIGSNLTYPSLGLAGEAGEVCGKISKIFRDSNGVVTTEIKEQLESEIGDVLWFLATLAFELRINLQDAANNNLKKLQSRLERGTIKGSGDNR